MPDSAADPGAAGLPSRAAAAAVSGARERAIKHLTECFAHDRISLEEFERRVTAAYRATMPESLLVLTADLSGSAADPSPPTPVRIAAVFANAERASLPAVPAQLELQVLADTMKLDLRRAHFESGVTEIELNTLMGNIEVQLPPGVHVENHASSLLGSFECRAQLRGRGALPSATPLPVVRFTGRIALSNVSVVL